jgi:hypothetical protein
MGVTVACPSGVLATISPSEGPISQLSHAGKGLKRAKVELRVQSGWCMTHHYLAGSVLSHMLSERFAIDYLMCCLGQRKEGSFNTRTG